MPGLIAKTDMQEPDRDEIFVYTGAVFEGVNRTLGRGRVGVPSHLFKIVWDSELEEVFTWLIPNDDFDFVDIADFVPWLKTALRGLQTALLRLTIRAWFYLGEGVMQDAEIKTIIESSFKPYHCGVEIMLASETFTNELRFRVSNVDDTLNYEDTADLKVVRESLNQLIPIWRREAENRGFKLDPL